MKEILLIIILMDGEFIDGETVDVIQVNGRIIVCMDMDDLHGL